MASNQRYFAAALALFGLLAVGALPPASAATAPTVSITSFKDLPSPLPYPYDTGAAADAQVGAAEAQAAAAGKLLLIDLGGNWCPDCRILAGVMRLPEVAAFVDAHYVVVPVDVGRMDKNLQVPKRYGITQPVRGVPSVLVIDPTTHKVLNQDHIAALADARSMTPQALADWLARWVP